MSNTALETMATHSIEQLRAQGRLVGLNDAYEAILELRGKCPNTREGDAAVKAYDLALNSIRFLISEVVI